MSRTLTPVQTLPKIAMPANGFPLYQFFHGSGGASTDIVNPTMKSCDIRLEIAGAKLSGNGTRWQIAGNDPMAHNAPGKEPPVRIEQSPVGDVRDKLSVTPCSVTLVTLEAP